MRSEVATDAEIGIDDFATRNRTVTRGLYSRHSVVMGGVAADES